MAFYPNFIMPLNEKRRTKQLYLFFLQLLDFVNKEDQFVNVVPNMNTMNKSFKEPMNS